MSTRRSVFNEVGGFSSSLGRVSKYPAGAEETELFIRIHRQFENAVVFFEPESVVDHRVGLERGTASYFRRRCYAEGLSKTIMSQLDQGKKTLNSEWSYTLKTLPLGALRGNKDAINGDRSGFGQTVAIVSGLFITTAGYLRGRLIKGPERTLTEVPQNSGSK